MSLQFFCRRGGFYKSLAILYKCVYYDIGGSRNNLLNDKGISKFQLHRKPQFIDSYLRILQHFVK